MPCVPRTTLDQSVSHLLLSLMTTLIHAVFNVYYYMRKTALPRTRYWPHLVIYLNAPVKTCLQRIKQRGNINEIAVVDEKYLGVMEDSYKDALREFK